MNDFWEIFFLNFSDRNNEAFNFRNFVISEITFTSLVQSNQEQLRATEKIWFEGHRGHYRLRKFWKPDFILSGEKVQFLLVVGKRGRFSVRDSHALFVPPTKPALISPHQIKPGIHNIYSCTPQVGIDPQR